jgi:pimeloyl-ACP methyl ester carboxylesterase
VASGALCRRAARRQGVARSQETGNRGFGFLRVDQDLLAAAAEGAQDGKAEDTGRFREWVEHLPARERTRWLLRAADHPGLALGSELLGEFHLAAVRADADGLPGLGSFAAGLEHDLDAVTGLTTHWSSGPIEGRVNHKLTSPGCRYSAGMATFVLIPGAWLGAWAWQGVAPLLRAAGHDAYPISLTGLGERAHLASPQVDLDTHITDVVNLLEFEDLHDAVVVGHSYAGSVITGVADRSAGRIGKLVYLDTGPLAGGSPFVDMAPQGRPELQRLVDNDGDGWRLPPILPWDDDPSLKALDPGRREWVRARAVAQPFGTYTQPLRLGGHDHAGYQRWLVTCSFPLAQVREMIASGHPWFRELAQPGWRFLELLGGHWQMLSAPEGVAHTLNELSSAG